MSIYFDENKAQDGHGRQSLRSGAVSVAARGVNIFVQVGSTIFLARLLSPHDYGLVAMVSAIVGFAPMLIDLGTADAVVQKPRVTQAEVSALFWLNLALGLVLALAMVACSPLIAAFYGEAEVRLITVASSLNFVFAAISCQHYALLRRAMKFQRIALIDVGASLLGAIMAVGMALSDCGYWSLVARPIFTALFAAGGVWWSCRWLPSVPEITAGVKEMVKFGMNITGFTMTDYAGRSADRVALGYAYGPKDLGYFQNASVLYENLLSLLTSPLHTVAVTSLSKLRANPEELRRCWATALSSLSFFAMPAFGILAVTSQEVVVLLLGTKWTPAGPLLSIFALRGLAHVVERTLGWLHVAAGRSDRWFRWGVVSSVVQICALFCGLPFGLKGVAVAYTVSMYLLVVPAIAYAGRPLGIGAASLIKVAGPQFVAALCAAVCGFWLRDVLPPELSGIVRIATLASICCLLYLLIAVGLFKVYKPLRVAGSLFQDFLPGSITDFGRAILRGVAKKS